MATAKKSEVKIVPDDTAPEVLAKAIVEVSEAAKKLLASRLTNEAVLVLLKHQTGVPMRHNQNGS